MSEAGRDRVWLTRLAGGERLYSDVRHIYGPLSPWLHAALFRAFGPSLTILYGDGILCAVAILAVVYWLGRQVMSPAAAATATLSVMWLCVFKPAGNYILPYSYNALHGTVLGLVTLAILTSALTISRDPRVRIRFFLAGCLAGLAMLAKTEMGLGALTAGVGAAVLAAHPDRRRVLTLAILFLAPAACLTIAVYTIIAWRVGWSTLVSDSWLLAYNLPPELARYQAGISGFDEPLRSLSRMLIAAVKLAIVAAVVGAVASATAGAPAGRSRAWYALAAAIAAAVVLSVTTGLDWDRGPYLAMPFLLVGVLTMRPTPIVTLYAIYAVATLARVILHVRSGGAYGSFLLPVSVIVFTYLWVGPFADRFGEAPVRRAVRAMALALLFVVAVASAGILAWRYRMLNTVGMATARGTMMAPPDVGQAWNEALAYIDVHTRVGDAVAVMPEGTSLDFLSGRRNPLREEITTPGYLDAAGEARAIRQLRDAQTGLILIANRPTREFGAAAFGRDYCQQLMRWIEIHYAPCAIFGPVKDPRLQIGDRPFFIRAYCRR
ncbi:MAG TPA: glycosyltransferase family 39 protein [Vicinamibacterales bacterium]